MGFIHLKVYYMLSIIVRIAANGKIKCHKKAIQTSWKLNTLFCLYKTNMYKYIVQCGYCGMKWRS